MRKAHHVPLSRQAVELFRKVQSATGPTGYVFPSIPTRTRPMSENAINAGLRRLGYASDETTGHGFRAMASTLLNECGKWHLHPERGAGPAAQVQPVPARAVPLHSPGQIWTNAYAA